MVDGYFEPQAAVFEPAYLLRGVPQAFFNEGRSFAGKVDRHVIFSIPMKCPCDFTEVFFAVEIRQDVIKLALQQLYFSDAVVTTLRFSAAPRNHGTFTRFLHLFEQIGKHLS